MKYLARIGAALSVSSLLLGTFAFPVFAQSNSATPQNTEIPSRIPAGSVVAPTAQLPSCFDYYQFGSVQVSLDSRLSQTLAGTDFGLEAHVQNKNTYPLINTNIYIRVFKQRATTEKNVNGPDVVGYFPIAQGLTLKPGEIINIPYTWHVPDDADPGAYQMVSFVNQADRFNFLGLPFTDDITGGQYNFSIVNSTKGGVRFNRSSAVLGGNTYNFAAFSPQINAASTTVPISISVNNTKPDPYTGDVTWKLYKWDGSRPDALISQKTDPLAVQPNGTTTVSYVVTDTFHSVYYITAEVDTKTGSRSIAAFRFVRANVFEPRIASLEATTYPLSPGSLAFACFHSSGANKATGVHLELAVKTLPFLGFFSFPIASRSYDGDAPGNILALTLPVTKNLSSFELVATLNQNGKQIDQVIMPYDCRVLTGCKDYTIYIVGGIVLLLLILCIALLLYVRRSSTRVALPAQQPPTP